MRSLLEEARESWDNVVSDEIIYGSELSDPDLEPTTERVKKRFSEYNVGHLFIDLNFKLVGQRNGYFHCVTEIAPLPILGSKNPEFRIGGVKRHDNVFVGDTQFVNYPEGISLVKLPSVIRLKRFYDGECGGKYILDGVPEPSDGIGRLAANGKRGSAARALADVEDSKLPSQLIETRSDSIGELSGEHCEKRRDRFDLKPDDMSLLLRIVLFGDSVTTSIKESLMFKFEFLQMDFCPIQFGVSKKQRIDEHRSQA
jgi:hypothetical protein